MVIRDRRKVDMTSGTARPAGDGDGPAGEDRPDGAAEATAADAATADATATPDAAATDGSDGDAAAPAGSGGAPAEGEVVEGEVLDGASEGPRAEGCAEAEGGAGGSGAGPAAPDPTVAEVERLREQVAKLRDQVDERTSDLRRVTAEYANYRKRVDRDRTLAAEQATGTVLMALLPVLDDLDRAKEHGDLVGPFGAVADQLVAALTKFGLTAFGSKGDPFDPTRHEAVAHLTSPDVTEPSCVEVMRRGYLLGDRLLRAAMVAVADPE